MELNLADGVGDGLLGFVWVFGTSVNLEFRILSLAEASLGKHAVDCTLNQKNGAAFANHAWSFNLIGVDHDHEIASINMSGEGRLVLAAKESGSFDSDLAEDFALSVDHIPFAVDFVGLGGKCLHVLVMR
jgi:hypothetical protein